ncbi:MAG: BACON domain-containing protein [Fermentimonas sp.]|jgi:hypothetical protein
MRELKFASLLAVALLVLSFGMVSCSEDDENLFAEESTLTLSQVELTIDNKEQEVPQVTFISNQPTVDAFPNVDWLDVKISGTAVNILADKNEETTDRKGEVVVMAGNAVETITITQSAADLLLEVDPMEVKVPHAGKEILVSVTTNDNTWTVEQPSEDWVVVERFTPELVKIIVKPNEGKESRSVTVFAQSGNITRHINISQQGISGPKFMLPLLKYNASTWEIVNYETQQNNFMVHYTPSVPLFGKYEEKYTFASSSPVFIDVIYTKSIISLVVTDILMRSLDYETIASDELRAYLEDNGFKLDKRTDKGYMGTLLTDESETSVEVITNRPGTGLASGIAFSFKPRQVGHYETFKEFPWDRSVYLKDLAAHPYSKIKQTELDEGGIIEEEIASKDHPEYIEVLAVNASEKLHEETSLYQRNFFMQIDLNKKPEDILLDQFMCIWDNVTLGARKQGNVFLLTDEFKELMREEGFAFYGTDQGGNEWYIQEDENILIIPRGARYTDILNGQEVFSIHYVDPTRLGKNMMSLHGIERQEMLNKLSEQILNRTDELLHRIK